jgi:hypothetical protein
MHPLGSHYDTNQTRVQSGRHFSTLSAECLFLQEEAVEDFELPLPLLARIPSMLAYSRPVDPPYCCSSQPNNWPSTSSPRSEASHPCQLSLFHTLDRSCPPVFFMSILDDPSKVSAKKTSQAGFGLICLIGDKQKAENGFKLTSISFSLYLVTVPSYLSLPPVSCSRRDRPKSELS